MVSNVLFQGIRETERVTRCFSRSSEDAETLDALETVR